MLSILIPTFNDSAYELVKEIHQQCNLAKINFEVLVFDDASTDLNCININNKINKLSNASYTVLNNNIGRCAIRNQLAKTAQYDWLLFLDADVFPKSQNFINFYLQNIHLQQDVVFGGFMYHKSDYSQERSLRWRYGHKYEQKKAKLRNLTPERHTISANVLIKKSIFISLNLEENNRYGMDIRFGILLKELNCKIHHVDNEVIHKGLEKNHVFINKTEQSIDTLLYYYRNDKIQKKDHNLLNFYCFLKTIKLHYLLNVIYPFVFPMLKINLLSNRPNPTLFQYYKLLYLSRQFKKTN